MFILVLFLLNTSHGLPNLFIDIFLVSGIFLHFSSIV